MANDKNGAETKVVDKEVAIKTLQADAQKRVSACNTELNAVMKKYGCTLAVHQGIEDGRIVARVSVQPQ